MTILKFGSAKSSCCEVMSRDGIHKRNLPDSPHTLISRLMISCTVCMPSLLNLSSKFGHSHCAHNFCIPLLGRVVVGRRRLIRVSKHWKVYCCVDINFLFVVIIVRAIQVVVTLSRRVHDDYRVSIQRRPLIVRVPTVDRITVTSLNTTFCRHISIRSPRQGKWLRQATSLHLWQHWRHLVALNFTVGVERAKLLCYTRGPLYALHEHCRCHPL